MSGFGSGGSSTHGTSQVDHDESKLFPDHNFLSHNFDVGVYAIIDTSKATCFMFQVGPDQHRGKRTVQQEPADTLTLSVDGKTVSYWPSSSGSKKEAYFQVEGKGYRNTYKLDCAGRRFLWTENLDLATGAPTDNAVGAEWKPLSPKSTTANAVYDAICPTLLSIDRLSTAGARG